MTYRRAPLTGVLASYWYFRNYDFDRFHPRCPLILDSGAFSAYTSGAQIDVNDYASWLIPLQGRYQFAFNLDALGDPDQSLTNWRHLKEQDLLTVPVIHYGDRPDEVLPPYIQEGADRLALGGIAVSGAGAQVMGWVAYVFRWLRDHGHDLPVHGLGVHLSSPLARLPWATTDSSSFSMAWRFARLRLYMGNRQWRKVNLDGREPFRYGAQIRSYGIDPASVAVSNSTTRPDLIRLATRIEVRAAGDYPPTDRYVTTTMTVQDGLDLVTHEAARFLAPGAGIPDLDTVVPEVVDAD